METDDVFYELDRVRQELTVNKAKNFIVGEHRSRVTGRGLKMRGFGKWTTRDPVADIAWHLSLPTWPHKIKKHIKIERKISPLMMLVDVSPSMGIYIDEDLSKFRTSLKIIGAFGFAASYFQDPAGFLFYSDLPEFYLPPRTGKKYIYHAVGMLFRNEILSNHGLRGGSGSHEFDQVGGLNSAIDFTLGHLKQESTIVIISDLTDIISGMRVFDRDTMGGLAAYHNFNIFIVILDDINEFMWRRARGQVLVEDSETGQIVKIDASRALKIRDEFVLSRQKLIDDLELVGVGCVVVDPQNYWDQLVQFLEERRAISSR